VPSSRSRRGPRSELLTGEGCLQANVYALLSSGPAMQDLTRGIDEADAQLDELHTWLSYYDNQLTVRLSFYDGTPPPNLPRPPRRPPPSLFDMLNSP
jgi:hypothetical protein